MHNFPLLKVRFLCIIFEFVIRFVIYKFYSKTKILWKRGEVKRREMKNLYVCKQYTVLLCACVCMCVCKKGSELKYSIYTQRSRQAKCRNDLTVHNTKKKHMYKMQTTFFPFAAFFHFDCCLFTLNYFFSYAVNATIKMECVFCASLLLLSPFLTLSLSFTRTLFRF